MKVGVSLFYQGAAQKFGKAHFFDVGDFEELLRCVYNGVSEKYGSLATIRKNTPGMYKLDGTIIPEESTLPEPKAGNTSIDILFEQGDDITSDSTNLVRQMDGIFKACNKQYRPMGTIISER